MTTTTVPKRVGTTTPPRTIEAPAPVVEQQQPPTLLEVPSPIIAPEPSRLPRSGPTSTASPGTSSLLAARLGAVTPLAGGDAPVKQVVEALAALAGKGPKTALTPAAVSVLVGLGHVVRLDRPAVLAQKAALARLEAGLAAWSALDLELKAAVHDTSPGLLGSLIGRKPTAEAAARVAELQRRLDAAAALLGDRPVERKDALRRELAALVEADGAFLRTTASAAPFAELLAGATCTSTLAFARGVADVMRGISAVAANEKRIHDDTKNCDHVSAAAYALTVQATGVTIDRVQALHRTLYDGTKSCGVQGSAILGVTALTAGTTVDDLRADFRAVFDGTKNCGDAASATLVYASRVTQTPLADAQRLQTRFYAQQGCGDEAAAVLTLAALRYHAPPEKLEALFAELYDIKGAGDVAAAAMALDIVAGRTTLDEARASFRVIYDGTKGCGDYPSVLLARAARSLGAGTALWSKLFGAIRGSERTDEAAALLAAGGASFLVAPGDRASLSELAVIALAGRSDEIGDAKRAERAARSQSEDATLGLGVAVGYGVGTGYGFGAQGFGFYTSGVKLF